GAAVEGLGAVRARPNRVDDVTPGQTGRQRGVPVVVATGTARVARRRRQRRRGERRRLQLGPGQRLGLVPAGLGDVERERPRVRGPLVVLDLDVRAGRQVGDRPVAAGLVESGEVVVVAVPAAQLAVRDQRAGLAAGGAASVADGEPVVQRRGAAAGDGCLTGWVLRDDLAGGSQSVLIAEEGTTAGDHHGSVG